ncbi:MAG: SprT-like domain-containing protein [Gammaproteobacteria bacterium]|nr:SprT-like domain-containing protein [Gammaproteobacteria bacterium]
MTDTPSTIQPLSTEKQQLVIEETQACIDQATNLFGVKDTGVEIVFNLKGRTAGMYRVKCKIIQHKREIRYNPFIFSKYFDDNFKTTIPHEVAHYISDLIYGLRNIKPHGKEWKEIMQAFNADATVTANYDLTGIPQNNKTLYTYECGCREHQIGAIRHNRIKNQHGKYICSLCKQTLYFKPPAIVITT